MLVFRNTLRSLTKKPIQLLGIILIVLISSASYSVFNTAKLNLDANVDELFEKHNVEHFSFYNSEPTESDLCYELIDEFSLTFATPGQSFIIDDGNGGSTCNITVPGEVYNFINDNSVTYGTIVDNVNSIFDKKIIEIQSKYPNIKLEKQYELQAKEENFYNDIDVDLIYKVLPSNINNSINTVNLVEGVLPVNDNEIAMLTASAEAQGYSIGDKVTIADQEVTITALITSVDYVFPVVKLESIMYKADTQNLIYGTKGLYDSLDKSKYLYKDGIGTYKISGVFNDGIKDVNSSEYKELYDFITSSNDVKGIEGTYLMFHQSVNMRSGSIKNETEGLEVSAYVLSIIVLVVATIVVSMMVKKRLENESSQIGVLKSLGYSSSQITLGYMVYPIVSVLIGGILGYITGLFLSMPFTEMYAAYYIIPIKSFTIGGSVIAGSILLPFVVLTILSFIVVFRMLNKPALELLRPTPVIHKEKKFKIIETKKGIIKLIFDLVILIVLPLFILKLIIHGLKLLIIKIKDLLFKYILSKRKFKTRFKYSLAFSNVGRILGLVYSILIASFLMVFMIIFSSVPKNIIDSVNGEQKYTQIATTALPIKEGEVIPNIYFDPIYSPDPLLPAINLDANKTDKFISVNNNIIVGKKGKKLSEDDYKESITIKSYDLSSLNLIEFKDNSGNNITNKLNEGILISKLLSEQNRVVIGDTLTVRVPNPNVDDNTPEEEKYIDTEFKISGIVEEFMTTNIYMSNDDFFSSKTPYENMDSTLFNNIVSTEIIPEHGIITSNLNIDELNKNITDSLKMMDAMIIVIVIVSVTLAIIIISIMTNFNIEDNTRNISLLKVMGYERKEINTMVLNIYLPFVIIGYFIAIPISMLIMQIVSIVLSSQLGFSLPIKYDVLQAMGAAIFIVGGYFISMKISGTKISKITLNEALKID